MAGGGKFIVSFAAVYTVVDEIPAVKLAAGLLTKDSAVNTTNQLTILVMNLSVEVCSFYWASYLSLTFNLQYSDACSLTDLSLLSLILTNLFICSYWQS